MASDSPHLRLGIVGIIALSLFAALQARLWYLQVLSAPEFQSAAAANSVRVVEEQAPRGRILDKHGNVLVDNRPSNIVAVDRAKFATELDIAAWSVDAWNDIPKGERTSILQPLADVLEEPVDVLEKRLIDQRTSPYTPIPIARDVADHKMVRLMEHGDQFPSVVAKRVAVRNYPIGNLAPHLLGYTGIATEKEIESSGDELNLGDQIGKAGVELAYDRDLRGEPGVERIEVDARGKPIRVVSRKAPVPGHDIVLTIDAEVQRVAEEALDQGLRAARGRLFEDDKKRLIADAGSVVVLDAQGGVVAMASNPTYDLPGLADGITDEEYARLYPRDGKAAPFLDRALQGGYAPGSTWKLVTADAALRNGLINARTTIDDDGSYEIGRDCTMGCTKYNAGRVAWDLVDVTRALAVSSDVFFYDIGADFYYDQKQYGEDPIQRQAAAYGFGQSTGIPLPGEDPGLLLTPTRKKELAAERSSRVDGPDWFAGNNTSLAIGQDAMFVTPLQLANAYATFANRGDRYQPNIALRVQKADKTLVREIPPRKVSPHVDLPPAIYDPIVAGLERVITYEKGTAYNAFLGFPQSQWRIAGKTGTAQAPPKQDTALFVGFGPLPNPQYTVAVVMEQSGFGATSAAPVARRLFGQLSGLEAAPVQFVQANGVGD